MITIEIVKSIKDAVVKNNIEVSFLGHVMWDVYKKEYKFYEGNIPFYYTLPNGETCMNSNPFLNIKDLMSMTDEDVVEEINNQIEENKEYLENIKDLF